MTNEKETSETLKVIDDVIDETAVNASVHVEDKPVAVEKEVAGEAAVEENTDPKMKVDISASPFKPVVHAQMALLCCPRRMCHIETDKAALLA